MRRSRCLAHALELRGVAVRRQVAMPVVHRGIRIETGFRLDLLVAEQVVVEVKAVDALLPVHAAQLPTHPRFGLLLDVNLPVLKQGIRRLVPS